MENYAVGFHDLKPRSFACSISSFSFFHSVLPPSGSKTLNLLP